MYRYDEHLQPRCRGGPPLASPYPTMPSPGFGAAGADSTRRIRRRVSGTPTPAVKPILPCASPALRSANTNNHVLPFIHQSSSLSVLYISSIFSLSPAVHTTAAATCHVDNKSPPQDRLELPVSQSANLLLCPPPTYHTFSAAFDTHPLRCRISPSPALQHSSTGPQSPYWSHVQETKTLPPLHPILDHSQCCPRPSAAALPLE